MKKTLRKAVAVIASATVLATTAGVGAIAANATETPNYTCSVNAASLKWGYKHSWRSHMDNHPIGSAQHTNGTDVEVAANASERTQADYGYVWRASSGSYTNQSNPVSIAFDGSLQYQKYLFPPQTDYLVDTTISGLKLEITSPTQAQLVATVKYRKGSQLGSSTMTPFTTETMTLANVALPNVDLHSNDVVVNNAVTTFTPEGGNIVGGNYTEADPVSFEIHSTCQDQVAPEPEVPGDRDDSGDNGNSGEQETPAPAQPQVGVSSATYKVGEELQLMVSGLKPSTTYQVWLHSDPVKLGELTTDETGSARFAKAIPESVEAGEHTVQITPADSTDVVAETKVTIQENRIEPADPTPAVPEKPEAEKETTPSEKLQEPVAIQPAPAVEPEQKDEPRCVTDPNVRGAQNGTFSWGLKRSFYSYMLSSTAGHPAGKVTPSAGASNASGIFNFPVINGGSNIDTAKKTGRLNFVGSVNFYKYNGILNLTISNPSLVVTGARNGYIELTVTSTDMQGKVLNLGRINFANVTFANANFGKDRFNASTSSVTLTEAGAKAFAGFMTAGAQLDNLSVNVGLGDKVTCYDKNGNVVSVDGSPVLANTGVEGLTYTLVAILALLFTGAVSVVAVRKATVNS